MDIYHTQINIFFNTLIPQLEKYENFKEILFFSYELDHSTLVLKKEIKENNKFEIIADLYSESGNILSFIRNSEEESFHLYKDNVEITDNIKDIVLQSLNLTAFYDELHDRFNKKEEKLKDKGNKIQKELTEQFIEKFNPETSFFIAIKELGKNFFNPQTPYISDKKDNFLQYFCYSLIFLKNSNLLVNEQSNLIYQYSNNKFNLHLNISSETPEIAILSLFDQDNLNKKEPSFKLYYHFNKEPNLFKYAQFFVNNVEITNEKLISKLCASKILQKTLQEIKNNVIDDYYVKNPMLKTTLDDLDKSKLKNKTHSIDTVLQNILQKRLSFNDEINSKLTKKIN